MISMIGWIAAAALLQQELKVERLERADYVPAIERCREAEGLIDSDPGAAAEKLDSVIGNARIEKKIEARLRVWRQGGGYDEPYDFFPYQYRGRARLNLARKDAANAEKHLRGAVEDLRKSVDKGVASSEPHLKAASAELEKARAGGAPSASPARALVQQIEELASRRAFRAAREELATGGSLLPESDRKRLLEDLEARCRAYFSDKSYELVSGLARLELKSLPRMPDEVFARRFALPSPDEAITAVPPFEWTRQLVAHLQAIQSGRPASEDAFLESAASAASLETKKENFWVQIAMLLGFQAAQAKIQTALDEAQNAPAARRAELAAAVRAVAGKWAVFARSCTPSFHKRHPFVAEQHLALEASLKEFPVELEELAGVRIDACLAADDAEGELRRLEEQLAPLTRRERVAIESRQKLYTSIVVVRALLHLLGGGDEEGAFRAVGEFRGPLLSAGIAPEAQAFGPRVSKVFERLAQR